MSNVIRKEDTYKLVDQLSANATWDDLMHESYVGKPLREGWKTAMQAEPKM